jgi:HEAT repeat protein
LFALAENATVVARGRVESVQTVGDGALHLYKIRLDDVVKGAPAKSEPLALVQERLFRREAPYFAAGATTLVFGVPFPLYTAYQDMLPAQTYYRWPERTDAAKDMADLGDPAVAEAVRSYLALRGDPPELVRHLVGLLGQPSARVRNDALVALAERREAAAALSAAALAPLGGVLDEARIPVADRAKILVTLGRLDVQALAPIANRLAQAAGPLQAPALDALVSLGRLPSEERLLGYSRSADPALRLAAARGLARGASPGALDRLTEMLASDPSPEVQVSLLEALGSTRDDRAVPLLAGPLRSGDKPRIYAAAEGLARIGSPLATAELGRALVDGKRDTGVAAAFALKRVDTPQAIEILQAQLETHPDLQVRKAVKLALGGHPDEHE